VRVDLLWNYTRVPMKPASSVTAVRKYTLSVVDRNTVPLSFGAGCVVGVLAEASAVVVKDAPAFLVRIGVSIVVAGIVVLLVACEDTAHTTSNVNNSATPIL